MNEVPAHSEYVPPALERGPLVLRVQPAIDLTSEQFFALCQLNRDLRFERTATGDIIVMPPTGAATGDATFDSGTTEPMGRARWQMS